MRLVPSPRLDSFALALLLASPSLACGDDGTTDTGADTNPVASTSEGTSSTGPATGTSSTGGDTSIGSLDDTGNSTTAASSSDGNTTGPVEDPAYPAPDGGTCPDGTLPVTLPGAAICAPFCGGPTDACPPAATGDALPQCTPFAGQTGSGDACDDATPCPDGETCSEGACLEIAFYACQLSCAMDEACPDGMACSGIATCGYP